MGQPGRPFPQPVLGAPRCPTGRGAVRQAHRRRFDKLTTGGETRVLRMFTSESATPRAFVYSFPIRWPISSRRPRKPIPEQVKPVEGRSPPKPSPLAGYVHLRPHARGAQRRDEHGASLGGPPPPWPSPAGGGNRAPPRRQGRGEARFPVYSPQPSMRLRRTTQAGGWGNPVSPFLNRCWERLAPHRQGCGSTGSPQVGNPVSPYVHLSLAPCPPQSTTAPPAPDD